jgi:hypothetical protein
MLRGRAFVIGPEEIQYLVAGYGFVVGGKIVDQRAIFSTQAVERPVV